ncbi:DUF5682 family protein [Labedaea rhizosphaerae]|uniref:Uncharacterized protein n=1 Tax=Labedaea rhizosphaerae TaxID=598644 RepID=A0A4R6RTL5_LABRH|nr:DUF5682 family protein [Labedaea rhizosphaerae]TDP89356.1 hypothetical protein EV186_1133 [Labedaea rhizosphaerae]
MPVATPVRAEPAEVRLLGIRHHGPGSARAVAAELAEYRPDIVLIEGPPEADGIVHLAADPGMRPPVALLAHAVDDATAAAFWPFAVFSPEWQAIQHALAENVPVRFCDLSVAVQFADKSPDRGGSGDPLAELAAAAGYDDPERWWDEVVEHRRGDESPFEAIADAMTALREDRAAQGIREQRREASMRNGIRAARKEGFERIAVVCGAWHVPALREPLPPATHDRKLLTGLPKRKVTCTWVPWTHGRLASTSGYGAGITSPGWYHHLFTTTENVTASWLTQVARVLRAEDLPVSSAHVIEAVRLADTLAVLRERGLAGLAEVTEATRSVLCGGNDVQLDLVTRRLVVGELLGAVPDETPQAPVAADLTARAKSLRLRRDALEREIDIDLRAPNGTAKSQLLHQLRLLGIDWGVPSMSARRGTGTFRETWTLCWQPEFEVDLIAAGVHGTTVPGAAANTLRDEISDDAPLAVITTAVEDCLLAGLADALPDVLSALDTRAAADTDATHLMAALPALARAARYGDVRETDTGQLREVAQRMLARVCAGLVRAAQGIDEEAAIEMSRLVEGVHGAVGLLEGATEPWLGALTALANRDGVPPLLAGKVVRLLNDAQRLDSVEVALRLGRALTPGVTPAAAAGYIEGFFAGGALVLVHDERLLRVVDEWLTAVPPEAFVEVLPLLRRTFGAFAWPERRSIGERAAALDRPGARPANTENPVDDDRGRAVLPVISRLLRASGGAR